MNDELKDLDLSSMSFDQFVEYFFARKVVPDNEQFDYFLVRLRWGEVRRIGAHFTIGRGQLSDHFIFEFRSNRQQIYARTSRPSSLGHAGRESKTVRIHF